MALPSDDGAGLSNYRWVVLTMGTLVVFAALGLARFGYTVVLPDMQSGLNMGNTQAGQMATANLIGYLALSAIGGALASHFGPRAVITVGLAVAGLSMLATGFANGFTEAAIWRGITGLGSGASNVPVMGLMVAWFGLKRRGLATGIAVAGSSVAIIFLGPVVPRILSAYGDEGWRYCWFGFGAVTLVMAAAALILLRNNPGEMRPQDAGSPGPGAAPASKVVRWGAVYKSPQVWHLGLVYVAFGFSYIIYMTFFVKCLVAEGGYTKPEAGSLFMTMGWFSLLCGLIWGAVSDVIGRRGALVIVYLIQAVSFALFALWPVPAGFTISAILFGLTAWSIPAIVAATCGDMLGSRLAPAALGFVTLFFGIGQAAGPYVAGTMADASSSLLPAMLLAAGVASLGAVASAFLKTPVTTEAQEVWAAPPPSP